MSRKGEVKHTSKPAKGITFYKKFPRIPRKFHKKGSIKSGGEGNAFFKRRRTGRKAQARQGLGGRGHQGQPWEEVFLRRSRRGLNASRNPMVFIEDGPSGGGFLRYQGPHRPSDLSLDEPWRRGQKKGEAWRGSSFSRGGLRRGGLSRALTNRGGGPREEREDRPTHCAGLFRGAGQNLYQ